MTMAMAAATVMAGQCGQVGRGQRVNKADASTKATTRTMTVRMLTTKEMDRNLIPPGGFVQRNRTNNGGGGALDNDEVK